VLLTEERIQDLPNAKQQTIFGHLQKLKRTEKGKDIPVTGRGGL
jgi:hypothetical protein